MAMLSACAATTERLDHYADRVTTYNKEAELAQDRGILLNVLRASKRRPLSFFELQSVTAQGTPSGQIGFSIPLTQNGNGSTQAPTTTTPQFNLSGGPTIAANYIDTQEFYQGILKPIPMDTIDYFIRRGLSDDLLFNLFFSRAIIRVHHQGDAKSSAMKAAKSKGRWELTVSNYAGDDGQLDQYQSLVIALLNAGLTTEAVDADPTDFGPALTEAEAANVALLSKAATSTLGLNALSWCDLDYAEREDLARRESYHLPSIKDQDDACKKIANAEKDEDAAQARHDLSVLLGGSAPSTFYRLQKKSDKTSHVFCFSHTAHQTAFDDAKIEKDLCDSEDAATSALEANAVPAGALKAFFDQIRNKSAVCPKDQADCMAQPSYDVEFVPRSTYGVIYYLGEVARRWLYPDQFSGGPVSRRHVMVRLGPGSMPIPSNLDCNDKGDANFHNADNAARYQCAKIFDLHVAGLTSRPFLAVNYDGQTFGVAGGPMAEGLDAGPRADETNEVLDIVAELIALNRSAKDSPTSSLVTLVGSH